jgi:hypothetical protein
MTDLFKNDVPQCLCVTEKDPCDDYMPGFLNGPCVVCGHEEECHKSEDVDKAAAALIAENEALLHTM